jgi:hypothetical protein
MFFTLSSQLLLFLFISHSVAFRMAIEWLTRRSERNVLQFEIYVFFQCSRYNFMSLIGLSTNLWYLISVADFSKSGTCKLHKYINCYSCISLKIHYIERMFHVKSVSLDVIYVLCKVPKFFGLFWFNLHIQKKMLWTGKVLPVLN